MIWVLFLLFLPPKCLVPSCLGAPGQLLPNPSVSCWEAGRLGYLWPAPLNGVKLEPGWTFTLRTRPLPAPHHTGPGTGAEKTSLLPSSSTHTYSCSPFRPATAFTNLGLLMVHLLGVTGGSSHITECEEVWGNLIQMEGIIKPNIPPPSLGQ